MQWVVSDLGDGITFRGEQSVYTLQYTQNVMEEMCDHEKNDPQKRERKMKEDDQILRRLRSAKREQPSFSQKRVQKNQTTKIRI